MRKTRYFAGFLETQAKWLNKMAAQGWRLVECGMLNYDFEPCAPGQYQYCVEFVGHKSQANAQQYKRFLEDVGYRVFFKNINLNYAVGKVYWRPAAERGAKIGTSETTLNRELLIVEKENDGRPFELHTTLEDKAAYLATLRNQWLALGLIFLAVALMNRMIPFFIIAFLLLTPAAWLQVRILRLKHAHEISE